MRTVRNEAGDIVDYVGGIGEPCDLMVGSVDDIPGLKRCPNLATREVDDRGRPLFVCEEHFRRVAN